MLSDEFSATLNLIPMLKIWMNAVFVIAFGVFLANQRVSLVRWRLRRQIAWVAGLAAVVSQVSFEIWYLALQGAASTDLDQAWLADHDGGGPMIVLVVSVFKALVLVVACALVGLALRRRRRDESVPIS